ncbi:hypothetical protein NDU88_001102 [Pleurodeles waltl]|uniref:Uncharacterized protein n=1 Tax=Pleurodeles waltl TaxID=8319 RepID=A0AAV7U5F1_PLEWA|nr:hypothetical protein NDU88_001102 [Pleurodeles waltl]
METLTSRAPQQQTSRRCGSVMWQASPRCGAVTWKARGCHGRGCSHTTHTCQARASINCSTSEDQPGSRESSRNANQVRDSRESTSRLATHLRGVVRYLTLFSYRRDRHDSRQTANTLQGRSRLKNQSDLCNRFQILATCGEPINTP